MQTKSNDSVDAVGLRRRAEARLKKQRGNRGGKEGDWKTEADTRRLLQELQVHQVELELQNTEFQAARDEAEMALQKYTDLYDFAPVGYFSLDKEGRILEANLTGASLFGVERSRLINRPFIRFVVLASRPIFQDFLGKVFSTSEKQVCEVSILDEDNVAFWVDLQASSAVSRGQREASCRVAASDITALKRAAEAQRRLEALAAINQELNREIVRRQTVESNLKKSEQNLSLLLEQSGFQQKQLRQFSHQILQVQEEERKRISRELHDQIVQTLVGINVHLEALCRAGKLNHRGLTAKITRTQALVETAVEIVHRFARELRPALLDDLGLIAGVHAFLKDFTKQTGIHAHFSTFAGVEPLSADQRTVLYRVLQSALANVTQHAQASRVKVSLLKLADTVCLEIVDNGKSFMVDRVLNNKRNKRLGLIGMRERVEMVGGSLDIESEPHKGTTIRARIPVSRKPTNGGGRTR